MKRGLFLVLAILTLQYTSAQNRSVLVVAGGHSFDTLAFFTMLDALPGINYDFMLQPEANRYLANNELISYDIVVFYDMWRNISEEEKQAYERVTQEGKPLLFLHHSLVSYQNWPGFENIIGGRYVEPPENDPQMEVIKSTYRHDVWIEVTVCDKSHPVTEGMNHFRIFDEVYGNYRVGEGVKPLLLTNHPESTPVIAWENRYRNSRIIYIQPGHGVQAFENEHFRNLIARSIIYLCDN